MAMKVVRRNRNGDWLTCQVLPQITLKKRKVKFENATTICFLVETPYREVVFQYTKLI